MLPLEALRQQIRLQGETVRWLRAMPCNCYNPRTNSYDRSCTLCSFGQVYTEETLAAGVRVLVGQLQTSYEHPEFGIIKVGSLFVRTMPDEILLGNLDRLVLTRRRLLTRETLTRGETDSDSLAQPYPVTLRRVTSGDTEYVVGTDCELDVDGAAVTWLEGQDGPAAGAIYACEYQYAPVYWYVGAEEQPPRPVPFLDKDTPQKGFLVEKFPGEA